MIFSDRKLSRKLERTEARANVSFVETRARLAPGGGAEWIEVGGAFAMFDGVESPLTQTFGLGMFDQITEVELERLEEFFQQKKAPVFHEVSPLADPSLLPLLNQRGYRPVELTSVMFQPIGSGQTKGFSTNSAIETRIAQSGEERLWAEVAAAGWKTEMEGLAEFMLEFGQISASCEGGFPYLAEIDGKPIAAGMLFVFDGVALLAGASTIPEYRRRGAQLALLESRLRFSAESGCTLAMMCTAPGSQSQKNAQKNGFNIAYTRIKWEGS
ncbi:MAG: GNAT family N-acetyltransferase [Pyrinomonadaceae bacterium]